MYANYKHTKLNILFVLYAHCICHIGDSMKAYGNGAEGRRVNIDSR